MVRNKKEKGGKVEEISRMEEKREDKYKEEEE